MTFWNLVVFIPTMVLGLIITPIGRLLCQKRNERDMKDTFQYQLTLAVIVKNEGEYIEEWVAYHALKGVDRFVVYDNGSTDNTRKVLGKYIERELVEYIWYPGQSMQVYAYTDVIKRYKRRTKLLGFIDIDEFIVTKGTISERIEGILEKFPNYGGVAITWRNFGNSGHLTKPDGFVIENYLYCAKYGFIPNIKTIGNPRLMCCSVNPHMPIYNWGTCNVDEFGISIRRTRNEKTIPSSIHINHYFTKSEEECRRKFDKGMADTNAKRKWEQYVSRNKNDVYCDELLSYTTLIMEFIDKSSNRMIAMKLGCCLAYYKNHNNYGTSLQGYATVKVLQTMGHDVHIVRYVKSDTLLHRLRMAPLQLMSGGYKVLLGKLKKRRMNHGNPAYVENLRTRTVANNDFKDERMEPLCDVYVGFKALRDGATKYDAVLVGSDQVWIPLGLYTNFFNLKFVPDDVRKISYASSFGVSTIPFWQRRATRYFLNRIDFLSVREKKGCEIVKSLTGRDARLVCDPTLLRTKEEWEHELEGIKNKVGGDYVFCYLLGGNSVTRSVITKFAKDKGLKIVTLRHTDEYLECDEVFGDESPYDVNPLDFINLIRNARYVCTDSFHGTVFSVIFNKQFMTFYRFSNTSSNSRNSRIDSLFALFGLQERLHTGCNLTIQMDCPIAYEDVNRKVAELRASSLNFLKESLA